jgi:Amt family ammonium transporter
VPLLAGGVSLLMSATAVAQEAAEAAPTVNKGDTAWMLVSTLLVLMMIVPGLALFYGGLVRAKNVLSVLVQVLVVSALALVLWVAYGYSLAFDGDGAFVGGLGKALLLGVTPDSTAATFTKGVAIPEFVYIAFQGVFAAITCALVVGAIAERARLGAVLLFTMIWFTLAYLPIAHMAWAGSGYLFGKGLLDFAGGTVVHINAGIAGLVGAYLLGPRLGLGDEKLSAHNLPFTYIGAMLLWVGWFGFNAGSALEANGVAALAFFNTLIATAAGVLSWVAVEWVFKRRASVVGSASGAVAGLVAITPACGTVGVGGGVVIGLAAGVAGYWGVHALKRWLRADDSLDVFGVHGVCGIVGALLTGVFSAPLLGGMGAADFDIGHQLGVQALGVGITLVWSGVVALIAFGVARLVFGLRVSSAAESEGLDISAHGESAYEI